MEVVRRGTARERAFHAAALLALLLALMISIMLVPNRVVFTDLDDHVDDPWTVLRHASASHGGRDLGDVDLPYAWKPQDAEDVAIFQLEFMRSDLPEGDLMLYIAGMRREAVVRLNGLPLTPARGNYWADWRAGHYFLAHVSSAFLHDGLNRLVIEQQADDSLFSGHVGRVHVATSRALVPTLWLSDLLTQQLRLVSAALLGVLLVMLLVLSASRRDAALAHWLGAMAGTSLLVLLCRLPVVEAAHASVHYLGASAQITLALCSIGVALTLTDRPRPRLLVGLAVVLPLVHWILLWGFNLTPRILLIVAALLTLGGMILSAALLIRRFMTDLDWMRGLLALVFMCAIFAGLHDLLLAQGVITGPVMVLGYALLFMLASVMAIFTGWLTASLNQVDRANAHLAERLQAREEELARVHGRERADAQLRLLAAERERLMQDLHDGLSGHLVAIIALAEKPEARNRAVEDLAREALDDLRLVVQSLDIGEDDLRSALASFRERLQPTLRRLGVTLDWSSEDLPEISGVTPGTALSVLRILQEVVTNALRHGPATRINVIMSRAPDGAGACISVESDGHPPMGPPGRGMGLRGIERRAAGLGATTRLDLLPEGGAVFRLALPARLPGG